ncbi:MAG: DUF4369 domain-containing protein [Dysgonamonadaceae bacterium]|jgi:peroxiredoxin|nr:DUF4369 domain-containing protein [Dysgonamonadaceae bacterium]
MTRKNIVKFVFSGLVFALAATGCADKNKFTIEGKVKDGAGKILYFENITTNSILTLDSVKLGGDGNFKFKHARPEAPDFYRIRLNRQFITIAVDSTETVDIQTDTLYFAANCIIGGSPESEKIKVLAALQAKTGEAYNNLQKQFAAKAVTTDEYVAGVNSAIDEYKAKAREYIYAAPGSASAYFALLQQINKLLIFDPYEKADSKAFGAVANVWNMNYPNAARTKQLVGLYAQGLAAIRGENGGGISEKVKEMDSRDYFDFTLPSVNDMPVRLSEVGKGKVVLLDFTAQAMEDSPAHNRLLAQVYAKFHPLGLEIVQVSLDTDTHFWKNAVVNLPWISLLDAESVRSDIVKRYNVTKIPVAFVLNKEGECVKRFDAFDSMEKELEPLLKR